MAERLTCTPADRRVIFVVRQSPDWDALAADHAAGLLIEAARYLPPPAVTHFPSEIERCIGLWNALYRVDFFTCRRELRRIARATLDAVADAAVLAAHDVPARLPEGRFRLFFLDDDDWFAPDTAARMSAVQDEDVAVFPLPRLDVPVFTFSRRPPGRGPAIGPVSRFSSRYQTNNYALHPRLCTPERLAAMADHHTASAEADRLGLTDGYHDVILSATNKTPVSASVVERITQDAFAFRRHVVMFVAALQGLALPSDAAWMHEPVMRTADLFACALG
jgi:hypothetical protein